MRKCPLFAVTPQNLIDFSMHFKYIYIYGAGAYGQICYQYLQSNNINIAGFIVSQEKIPNPVCGIRVYSISEIVKLCCNKIGIIVAMNRDREVVSSFLATNTQCCIQVMSSTLYRELREDYFLQRIHFLAGKYPPASIYSLSEFRNILVIRLDSIGDMIWSTPFFIELKNNNPNSHVTLLLRRDVFPLIKDCPYIDEFILFDCTLFPDDNYIKIEKVDKEFAETHLQPKRFDAVFLIRYLPENYVDNMHNVFLTLYCGAPVKIGRSGYETVSEKKIVDILAEAFSAIIQHRNKIHEVSRILEMIELCGGEIHNTNTHLWTNERAEKFADNIFIKQSSRLIKIAIAPITNDKNRDWSPEKYEMVMRSLFKRFRGGIQFVLFGGGNALFAINQMELEDLPIINTIAKTSLDQASAIMKRCDIYLGGDTGLMHMAAAFGLDVVEISMHLPDGVDTGIHAPARVGPWNVKSHVITPAKGLEECRGDCMKNYPHCINTISVRTVIQALEEFVIAKKR